jgi:divalent metal cation (Fe/Co/Zn/Cd) transporter
MGHHQAPREPESLLRQGLLLEYATLNWNVVGTGLLLAAAKAAHSVALLGFGLDSLIEIGASTVVVWQLRDNGGKHRRRALQLISVSFIALAIYIGTTATYTLTHRVRPVTSVFGTVWLASTFVAMLALAAGKHRVGTRLNNPVLTTEARVTLIDAYLAASVLVGVALNGWFGWWWADPLAGLIIVLYGIREGRHAWCESRSQR